MALQMTCPFCHKEFPYDNGALDKRISFLGQRIAEINLRFSELKRLLRNLTRAERERLSIEQHRCIKEITEKKAIRKACDQQIKRFEYEIFKELYKEKYGEAAYKDMLDEVQMELQAYKISGLMSHEYSISRSKKPVTSINKL